MRHKLKDLATVSTGFSFRKKVQENMNGNIFVLQVKDLDDADRIDVKTTIKTNIDDVPDKYYLTADDIIFKSRGAYNRAAYTKTDKQLFYNVVIAAPLMIIRVDTTKVEPAYIAWYVNKTSSQLYFDKEAKGTGIRMISKKTLDELDVVVPSLEKQRQIVAMQELIEREKKLMEILTHKRKILLEGVLMTE